MFVQYLLKYYFVECILVELNVVFCFIDYFVFWCWFILVDCLFIVLMNVLYSYCIGWFGGDYCVIFIWILVGRDFWMVV